MAVAQVSCAIFTSSRKNADAREQHLTQHPRTAMHRANSVDVASQHGSDVYRSIAGHAVDQPQVFPGIALAPSIPVDGCPRFNKPGRIDRSKALITAAFINNRKEKP